MLNNPGAFGSVAGDVPPAEGIDVTDHRYRSAIIQHRIARNVQDGLRYADKSLPRFLGDFDGQAGLSLDRQRRVLRGETSATFADLTFWAAHFPYVAYYVDDYLRQLFLPTTAAAPRPSHPVARTRAPGP
ncbi:hypothetical protein ACFQRL_14175 [Microbacterium fluvii]|uniref:Uncharacterized protein n=1 Tax=Microbacterium fluvii TaxID=415215 RepID=A0ABW2HKA4_9MICO|nr:hypothetical protein [Microbacterium fluvii]MCU4673737.1 hypothetical protein [Microbacterium fluvii]